MDTMTLGSFMNYHIQCGIVGFFANEQELKSLYSVLNYYYNLDVINDVVVSITDYGVDDQETSEV